MFRFNITVKELEAALEFAETNDLDTITMVVKEGTGIGKTIAVATDWYKRPKDITDYEAW